MPTDKIPEDDEVTIGKSSDDTGLSHGEENDVLLGQTNDHNASKSSSDDDHSKLNNSMELLNTYGSIVSESETATLDDTLGSDGSKIISSPLRRLAIDLSLYLNLFILFCKVVAYIDTLSLSVLAAMIDSLLDVISQLVLNYTEKHSTKSRSSAFYPAGAARLDVTSRSLLMFVLQVLDYSALRTQTLHSKPFND